MCKCIIINIFLFIRERVSKIIARNTDYVRSLCNAGMAKYRLWCQVWHRLRYRLALVMKCLIDTRIGMQLVIP